MTTRHIQRTPNLGITLRLRPMAKAAARPAEQPAELRLAWMEAAGAGYTVMDDPLLARTLESASIESLGWATRWLFAPPAVAYVSGWDGQSAVAWDWEWQPADADYLDPPGLAFLGGILVVYAQMSLVEIPSAGVLTVRARVGGAVLGPLTLVLQLGGGGYY